MSEKENASQKLKQLITEGGNQVHHFSRRTNDGEGFETYLAWFYVISPAPDNVSRPILVNIGRYIVQFFDGTVFLDFGDEVTQDFRDSEEESQLYPSLLQYEGMVRLDEIITGGHWLFDYGQQVIEAIGRELGIKIESIDLMELQ